MTIAPAARSPNALRPYQARIVDEVESKGNSIVVLPTGAGKTHTAAELIRRALVADPGRSVLFFVPTKLLVEQQAAAVRGWLRQHADSATVQADAAAPTFATGVRGAVPGEATTTSLNDNGGAGVYEYFGGTAPPPHNFRVLVATPAAFLAAIGDGVIPGPKAAALPPAVPAAPAGSRRWDRYSMVVFDEVHHHLKDHPYRKIADRLRDDGIAQSPASSNSGSDDGAFPDMPSHLRILGLTATLSYAVDAAALQRSITKMRMELSIRHIATATKEELRAGGYHATAAQAKVDLPPRRLKGLVPLAERKPHMMLATFLKRCDERTATPCAQMLLELSETLEAYAKRVVGGDWVPPSRRSSGYGARGYVRHVDDYAAVSTWGTAAGKQYQQRLSAAGGNCPKAQALLWLMHAYEAVRIAVVSWEEDAPEAAAMYLRMYGFDGPKYPAGFPEVAADQLRAFFEIADREEYPTLQHLRRTLLRLYDARRGEDAASASGDAASAKDASAFHGVLFAEQRVVAHVLAWYVGEFDQELAQRFKCAVVHAETQATHLLRMSKAKSEAAIEQFRTHDCNLLVATMAAEEGMDIPSANAVVRYNAMHTAVSLVQGRGRAREAGSDFVVMAERPDRDVGTLEAAERAQANFIQGQFGSGAAAAAQPNAADVAVLKEAQRQRDVVGFRVLRAFVDKKASQGSAVAAINEFCQKARLSPNFEVAASTNYGSNLTFRYTATVCSPLTFGRVAAEGTAAGKQAAKDAACAVLVRELLAKSV